MKKILFLGILAFMLPFTSCNNDNESNDSEGIILEFYCDGLYDYDYSAHTFKINIFTSQKWTLQMEPPVSWCTLSSMKGEAGEQSVTGYLEENTEKQSREVILSLSCGKDIRRFKITQEAIPEEELPENYDFIDNGIYYQFLSAEDLTVAVVGNGNIYKGDIVIPDNVVHNGKPFKVTYIDYAFNNSPVTSVKIGNNVTVIENSFNRCPNLTSISIPASVTQINHENFEYCWNLSEIIFEDSSEKLYFSNDKNIFINCSPQTLYIGREIDVYDGSFGNLSALKQITIGKQVTTISHGLSNDTWQLDELIIPANVTDINCSLYASKIIFEDGDINLSINGSYITANTVYIGRNIIGPRSYYYTINNTLTIGNNVSSIPFYIGGDLTSVDIAASVKSIRSFYSCDKLREVICRGITPPEIPYYSSVFSNSTYIEGTLYVPEQSIPLYKEADGWKNFFDI